MEELWELDGQKAARLPDKMEFLFSAEYKNVLPIYLTNARNCVRNARRALAAEEE